MLETKIEYYQNAVQSWLESAGHYTRALDGNILVLASSLRRLAMAINETENLKVVSLKTPNGAVQQHPAFKMQREAEETILKQLKELGLTAEGTRGKVEKDPAVDLIQEMLGKRRPRIIKPDE